MSRGSSRSRSGSRGLWRGSCGGVAGVGARREPRGSRAGAWAVGGAGGAGRCGAQAAAAGRSGAARGAGAARQRQRSGSAGGGGAEREARAAIAGAGRGARAAKRAVQRQRQRQRRACSGRTRERAVRARRTPERAVRARGSTRRRQPSPLFLHSHGISRRAEMPYPHALELLATREPCIYSVWACWKWKQCLRLRHRHQQAPAESAPALPEPRGHRELQLRSAAARKGRSTAMPDQTGPSLSDARQPLTPGRRDPPSLFRLPQRTRS